MRFAVAGFAALAVAMGIGRFAFTPILPMMLQDAGISVAAGGWLASANYLGYFAGAVWAGAARVPGAVAIRAGLAAIALSTLAMASSTLAPALGAGLAAWAVLRFIAGVASAWVLVHTSAWVLERTALLGRPILAGILFAGVGAGIVVAGGMCLLLMAVHAGSASAWLLLGIVSIATTAALWPVFHTSNETKITFGTRHRWTWAKARLVLAYGAYGFGYIIPATFLPVMAREVVSDPAVFGWAWPVFGAAAALSTLGVAPLAGWRADPGGNRVAWIASHLVMALGVAAPVFWPGIGGIVLAAMCVGGTFVVITMVGMQEARTVAGAQAPRLMAAMTAAFAAGQIAGPLAVSFLVGAGGFAAALLIACAVLIAGAALLLPR
jgi:MFS family permease